MTDLRELRRLMLETAYKAGEGHLPSAFSVTEIIWALHNKVMGPDDQFVLSKGHACLALYVTLAEQGKIPREWLERFSRPGAELLGHPERRPECGIHATTGSLGHGSPMSVGMALAKKISGSPGRVFCLLGDQECNQGSVWEAALLATKFRLTNLAWIIDDNRSADDSLSMDSLGAKFEAFNWHVEIASGHTIPSLTQWLSEAHRAKPTCVVAHTTKGYGIREMELNPKAWHHHIPSPAQYESMLAELA